MTTCRDRVEKHDTTGIHSRLEQLLERGPPVDIHMYNLNITPPYHTQTWHHFSWCIGNTLATLL